MQSKIKVNWEFVKKFRLDNMKKYNAQENKKRIDYQYKVGDLVLIVKSPSECHSDGKLSQPTEGPYQITAMHNNAKVTILRNTYLEKMTIRRLKPCNA